MSDNQGSRAVGAHVSAACVALVFGVAQAHPAGAPVLLVPQDHAQIRTQGLPPKSVAALAHMPATVHHFGAADASQPSLPETLTLKFTANVTLKEISTSSDFAVSPGGSCLEGHAYAAASTCQLNVRFIPQGAGNRLGSLTVSSGTGQVVRFSLIGYSYFPVVSFRPSVITTVPATFSGGVGLINGATNLSVDGGDSLYIADTGNNVVEMIDSSGVMTPVSAPGAATAPVGVVADEFGEVWYTEPSLNTIREVFAYGPDITASGVGSDACTASAPCVLSSEKVLSPGSLSTNDGNTLFFTESSRGAAYTTIHPEPATLVRLYDPFTYRTGRPGAFAVDNSDNLYSAWIFGTKCGIEVQSLYNAENGNGAYASVTGTRTCGFSGDTGQARGARIGNSIGQIAFDLAGDLYFSDTANNRVRRIEAGTGIIRTIAGNGTFGYSGDGGSAGNAKLGSPTGVAVDSQGQVYILSSSAATGNAQVVRQVGTTGVLGLGSQKISTAGAARVLNVANTGNSNLSFLRATITGTGAADFAIDPSTTNCDFSGVVAVAPGRTCQVGVIFKPTVLGARNAVLTLVDNTVAGTNIANLSGTATP